MSFKLVKTSIVGICIALVLFFIVHVEKSVALDVQYADGFSIKKRADYTILYINLPGPKNGAKHSYVLVPRAEKESRTEAQVLKELSLGKQTQVIYTPVKNLIPLSTTFLPPLVWFDAENSLSAVDNEELIYSPQLRQLIEQQNLPQVGNGPALDVEKIVDLQPAVVLANFAQGEWNVIPKLKKASIPVVLNGDYLETTPLGRAEWIKFIGILLGKGKESEKRFVEVAKNYEELKTRVDTELSEGASRPQVVMNRPMNGRWVVPGGDGYMAQFIEDAGAEYLWSDDEHTRSLVLDVEEVFLKALRADFWLHQYGQVSLKDVLQTDSRLRKLKAFQSGHVVNNDARTHESGSNDFYESGLYRPDLILADLVSVFHPEILPSHTLYYYRYLK